MNTDIRVDVGFLDHWKTETLISECGADSVLSLIRIWIFAAQNKPTGRLFGIKSTMIERVAKWRGEGGKLLNCLTDLRFIEQDADGVWCLHDWEEHNPYAAHAEWRKERAKKANSARWKGRVATKKDEEKTLQGCYKDATSNELESSENPPSPSPSPSPSPIDKKHPASRKRVLVDGEGEFYLSAKKKQLRGQTLKDFETFWEAFAYHQGKAAAADAFLSVYTTDNIESIISGAKMTAIARQKIIDRGGTPKYAQGWLTERRWEDKIEIKEEEVWQ
jgi:hypothetical protein